MLPILGNSKYTTKPEMDRISASLNQRIHEFQFGGCVFFQHINVEHIHSVQHMVLTQEWAIILPAVITGAPLQTPKIRRSISG